LTATLTDLGRLLSYREPRPMSTSDRLLLGTCTVTMKMAHS
jgi:hypothetical protein